MTAAEKIMAKALTKSMRDVAKDAVAKGRSEIASAGFGNRTQKSLRYKLFPPQGDVLNPEAYIHSTINYLDIFERGGTIHGDPFLWVPLPTVPAIRGRPHMTPSQYVKNVGPLVTIKRKNGLPMLGAKVKGLPRSGKITRGRLSGKVGRGREQVIPLFVAVRSVTIAPKFKLTPVFEKAAEKLPKLYDTNEEKKPI